MKDDLMRKLGCTATERSLLDERLRKLEAEIKNDEVVLSQAISVLWGEDASSLIMSKLKV